MAPYSRDARAELMTAIGRHVEDARQHRKGDQKEGDEEKDVELLYLELTYRPKGPRGTSM